MKKLEELTFREKKGIEGGSIWGDIKDGVRAIKSIREFFSGRPQL